MLKYGCGFKFSRNNKRSGFIMYFLKYKINKSVNNLVCAILLLTGITACNASSPLSPSTNAILSMPVNGAATVGIATPIIINFSNAVESNTIISGFSMNSNTNGTKIDGTFYIESENFTFIPNSLLSMNTRYQINLSQQIRDSSGKPITPLTVSFTTQPESYTIFNATNSGNGWSGDLFSAAIKSGSKVANGIAAADFLCQTDSQCQTGWNCKAILAESSGLIRQATPVPVNWVLQAFTSYQNGTGNFIGITGESDITGESAANSATFAPKLSANFGQYGGWMGMHSDWSTSELSCNGWNTESSDKLGILGLSLQETIEVLINGVPQRVDVYTLVSEQTRCSASHTLFCAQQP